MQNTNNNGVLSYKEMRAVAQEILNHEKKMRRIRTVAMLGGGVALIVIVVLGGAFIIFGLANQTAVQDDGEQSALVKRGSDLVIATSQSEENMDVSELVDYRRDGVDAYGDPDGDWILSPSRLAMLKSISWKEGEEGNSTTYVEHVADVVRVDGNDTRVEITTKAGHRMIIWDSDGVDNFNVMIRRWDPENQDYMTPDYEEVLPEADEDEMGRGRVIITLERPRLVDPPRSLDIANYF